MWTRINFSRSLSARHSPIELLYQAFALLLNIQTCIYKKGQAGIYFAYRAPETAEYLNSSYFYLHLSARFFKKSTTALLSSFHKRIAFRSSFMRLCHSPLPNSRRRLSRSRRRSTSDCVAACLLFLASALSCSNASRSVSMPRCLWSAFFWLFMVAIMASLGLSKTLKIWKVLIFFFIVETSLLVCLSAPTTSFTVIWTQKATFCTFILFGLGAKHIRLI